MSQMPLWLGVAEEETEPDMVRAVKGIISREDAGLDEMKQAAATDTDYKLLWKSSGVEELPWNAV